MAAIPQLLLVRSARRRSSINSLESAMQSLPCPFPFPLFLLQVSLARSRFRSSSFLPPPSPMVLLSHTDVVRSSCRSRVRGRPRSGGGAEATEGRTEGRKEGQNERTKLRGRNRTPNVGTKRININGEGERRSMKNGAKISGQD